MKLLLTLSTFCLIVISVLFISSTFTDPKGKDIQKEQSVKDTSLPQVVKSVDMDRSYTFADEDLPTDNIDVKERLERELIANSYWHATTLLHLKAANRYFPVIEQILEEEEVPQDFKFLSVAESSLRNATSPSGAQGIWQFMKPTAIAYGLEINSEVDERYHLEKATRAACTYLKDYKKKFGTWTNAAAAYNMGGTQFSKALARQKEDSYYDLNLNQETMRYVFRIVAIKEVMLNPESYGYYLEEEDLHPPFEDLEEIEVSESISSLADFAHEYGATYRDLKRYNPWLKSHKLTISPGNSYLIKIPKT